MVDDVVLPFLWNWSGGGSWNSRPSKWQNPKWRRSVGRVGKVIVRDGDVVRIACRVAGCESVLHIAGPTVGYGIRSTVVVYEGDMVQGQFAGNDLKAFRVIACIVVDYAVLHGQGGFPGIYGGTGHGTVVLEDTVAQGHFRAFYTRMPGTVVKLCAFGGITVDDVEAFQYGFCVFVYGDTVIQAPRQVSCRRDFRQ